MATELARFAAGYLTAQYLMGRRGKELGAGWFIDAKQISARQLEGLRNKDQMTRAEWLARGLKPLQTALDDRRWDAQ